MQIVDDRTITIEILGKLPKNSCQFRYERRYILNVLSGSTKAVASSLAKS